VTPPGGFRVAVRPDLAAGCFIVAEVGQAHDASLGSAHAFIDAAAAAGCDAVKMQTHIASAESTAAEPWRVPFSPADATRYDYWRRMEMTEEQWSGLAEHAHERGLAFFSTPFSPEAVDLLARVGVDAWKVASGEVTNVPLLDAIVAAGGPVVLSTGMSTWAEIDEAVHRLQSGGAPLAVLQCTTAYPCPPERLGLNVLAELRQRHHTWVGLSDHSGSVHTPVAAAALGADVLEVHISFSRWAFGPDVPASLTVEELTQAVAGVRFVEQALAHPVDKDVDAAGAAGLRATFGRSVVAATDLPTGTVLEAGHLACKKPAGGLPPSALAGLVGRTSARPLARDQAITEHDLEPAPGQVLS